MPLLESPHTEILGYRIYEHHKKTQLNGYAYVCAYKLLHPTTQYTLFLTTHRLLKNTTKWTHLI